MHLRSPRDGPSVTVVIPNFDGGVLLQTCAASVLCHDAAIALDVVVVDNGSTDESAALLKQKFPVVEVLENEKNEGFSRACNQGASVATGNFVLFLNNDVTVTPNCIEELVLHASSDNSAAAWQPRLVSPPGRHQETLYSLLTSTGFLMHQQARRSRGPTEDAFSLKGACFLVRRSAFEEVGRFDESFFAYFEESDLCWRLQLAGWKVRFVDICCAEHLGGATSTRIFPLHHLDYLSFRNRLTSLLKNAEVRTLLTMLPLHLAAVTVVAVTFLVRGKWDHVLAIAGAVAAAAWRLPSTYRARRRVQRLRVVSDRELLRPLMVPMEGRQVFAMLRRYTTIRGKNVTRPQSDDGR